uniref:Filamin-like 6 n=1 Tax=Halisarca dujardinii TaxID=2583056 RepID=A0A9F1U426_HALDU|nr:filamin-like 6 [Halisarca dujardinii]
MAMGTGDRSWIAVQQNTFTNWCNNSLKGTGQKVEDIVVDLDDGVKLIMLLEQLSKKKVSSKVHYKPRLPAHKSENLEMAFDFMKNKEKIHMVNIGSRDIQEHNQKIILGLIWHLILNYHILSAQQEEEPAGISHKGGSVKKPPKKPSAKKLLLNWLKAAMPEDIGPVRNITTDWNDGKKLSALVNTMKPGLCPDYNSLSPSDALPNTKKAMEQAEEEFEVPQVIDPEHLCVDKPDELSCMTYLSYFCSGEDSPGYNNLLEWVRSKIPEYNIENFTDDWRDGRALSALVNAVAEGSLPSHAQLDPKRPVDNVREAMKTANDNLDGLVDNITPEEFAHKKTDALAMMGYIEWYRKAHVKKSEAVSAMGPGVAGGAPVAVQTYFHVTGKMPPSSLNVKVTDPDGEVVPVAPAQSSSPTMHKFTYTPTKPGKHTVNIDKDGSPIPDSPFFPVFIAKTDPTLCKPEGKGLSKGRVAKPAVFTVDCRRAGPGNLSTSIKSPSGNDVPVTTSGEGMHSAEYTPQEVGPHNIVILYSGHQVNGSPFTAIVRDPSKVVAKGDGLERGTVEEKAEFTVSTEQAGPGKPVVKVTGPQGELSSDVEELYDHNYKYSYVPQSAGPHPISVVFAEEDVPGSPFTAQVEDLVKLSAVGPGVVGQSPVSGETYFHVTGKMPPSSLNVKVTDPDGEVVPVAPAQSSSPTMHKFTYTPTKPGKHTVNIDKDGSPIPDSPFFPVFIAKTDSTLCKPEGKGLSKGRVAKPAVFTVDCRRAGPGNLSTSIKSPSGNDVPVTTSGEGMHSAEYTPQEVGPHNIVILYSGHQVNGSPFTAIVRDPSKVVAKGDGLENGTVGEKAEFAVSAKGAGPGKPVVKVTGPQGELSCDVEELYDHNYKYSYVPQSGGPHPISVVFAEEDVPGSPFTAQVKEAIPVDARKVAADGPHFPQMHRGPVFTDLNVSRAGDGQLSSTCHSNKFGSVPVTVSPPNGGVQRASFDPPGKDLYQQSVLWSGEHVPGSPFPVDLNPPLASEVRVDGPHPCIEGLGPVRTNIDVREAGDGQLTVKTSGERLGPVPTKVDPSGEEGRFRAEFQASQPDTYLQEVKWSGRAVPGSPFRVPVDLGEAMCLQEEMQDVESSYLPDSMADLYDQDETNQYTHSEPPEAIPSYFVGEKLSITADKEGDEPAGPVVAGCRGDTAGEIPVNLVSNPDGSRTAIIDPRVPDLYSVQVTMSGEHVPGSPFKVRYLPPPTDPSKCRLYNLPPSERRLVAHDDIMYSVDASQAGAGDLSIQSEGPSGAKTSTNLQVVPKENQDFKILYTPTKAGLHKHYIYWGKEAIPQSPVEFEVDPRDIPVYPWAKSVALDYEFPGLKAKDVSGHVLYQPSGKKVKSSVDKNKTQPEKMVASFKPLEAGIYEVHLLHHKNHVRGSPFEVRVLEPPRPDSVRVSGLEDAKCYVGDSVPFRADCSGAGTGELQMKVEGPAGEQEPSQLDILDNKDGTYSATFVPATVGNHLLHVKWADQPVPGSPYTVQAVPVEEPKMDAGLTIVEVGQPVDIQLADKPEDDVLASAKGDKTGSAHVLVQREEEGNHRVIFEPLLPDDYTVTVMLNESHIDGSPFRVKALEKTTIFADGEEGVPTTVTEVEVNSSVNFVLRPGPVEGSPDVRVIGPSGPLDTSTVSTEEGRYITHFKPDEEGDYFCNAKHDQKHLKGSPFRVLAVDRMKSDPSKCFILPEDVETMSSPYQHSQQVDFRVSTLNAGPGTLNVTSRGPGKADVVITDNKDGIYSVRFNPSAPGRYKLDVTWDEVSIRGSPCSVVIMGERKSRVLTGLDLSNVPFRVGKPYKFKIHCDELGEGEFGVKVEPAVDASVTVRDLGNRTYHVTLVPKQQGEHKVCVLHGNQHILGSPFACQFQQVGDASKCRLLEDAEEQQHEMGEKVSFLVTTEGAGPGVLSASVENIQKKTSAPADVEQTGDTTYRVTFDPGQEEEYMLSIKYDGGHIVGSPFRLSFSTPPDPSQCKAEGEGLVSAQENRESTFEVTTDGTNSDLRVEIEGGFEKVDPVVTPAGEGKYSVAYTPKFPGEYRIQVLWNDEPISGSPYTVKSYRPADPSSLQVNKASVKDGILGNSLAFIVNSDPGNDGEITIVAHGPNQVLDGTVVDNKDGTFGANFDPPEPGKYMVHVRYNGQHIEGSPFKVKVAAPPMPDKVKAYGPGLEDGIVDREGNFVVETKEAGAGTLAVRVHGPKGAFKINMKRDPTSERTILVRYDPTSVGEYTVDITWSETHVPGSPFKVQVRRAEEEPAAEEGQQNGDTAES